MAEPITMQIQVDQENLEKAEKIFKKEGFSIEEAVILFLEESAAQGKFPFSYEFNTPNEITAGAVDEE
jgi:antitoxin component of RelBE/YafQ-DinJ toxin-antitoxin module